MNHRIFEDWLFSHYDPEAEPLEPEEARRLEAHLATCQTCQDLQAAWQEAHLRLSRTAMAEPRPGFINRWHEHLEANRQRLHRRQTLLALSFCISAAVLATGSLAVVALPWLGAPKLFLWTWLYQMLTFANYLGEVREFAGTFTRAAADAVPLIIWVFIVGMVSEIGVLWVVSYRWLTNPRRVSE
jgi:predicted anti-sigma-YlaC factor YlaD